MACFLYTNRPTIATMSPSYILGTVFISSFSVVSFVIFSCLSYISIPYYCELCRSVFSFLSTEAKRKGLFCPCSYQAEYEYMTQSYPFDALAKGFEYKVERWLVFIYSSSGFGRVLGLKMYCWKDKSISVRLFTLKESCCVFYSCLLKLSS